MSTAVEKAIKAREDAKAPKRTSKKKESKQA